MKNSDRISNNEDLIIEENENRKLKSQTGKVSIESMDIAKEQLKELKKILPHILSEGKLDIARLKLMLGEVLTDNEEKYSFNWSGRKETYKNIQESAKGTLIPAPQESVNFESTENIFIEGDNLEVLKLLQKTYFNKIKMIYIDPPYNTGNDFIYKDDYSHSIQTYLEQTGQLDEEGIKLTSNPETSGRFHSNWMSMMYSRLFVSRNLLRDDGVIFVSIDDNEIHNLRLIMNEIFGEENFIDCIIWKKRYGGGAKEKHLVTLHEYVLFYAKDIDYVDPIFIPYSEETVQRYYKQTDNNFAQRGPYRTHPLEAVKSMGERKNLVFPIIAPDGTTVNPKRQWLWSKDRVEKAIKNNELEFVKSRNGWSVHTKQYLKDENGEMRKSKAFSIIENVYSQHGTNEIVEIFKNARIFPYPKPTGFMKPLLQIGLDDNDIVLDFFAGSATTAHSVLELNDENNTNNKFILVQLPEATDENSDAYKAGYKNIAEISKERIRRVISKNEKNKNEKLFDNNTDLGVKVFKLAKSNYRIWEDYDGKDANELKDQMTFFKSPLINEHKNIDVIYECIIKEGFNLNSKIEQIDIKSNIINKVVDEDLYFLICLDYDIKDETIDKLNLDKDTLFICLDEALDDTKKSNLSIQCKLKTI